MKCLVIDDSIFSRHMITRLLGTFGIEVTEAGGGEQGLKLIEGGGFDFVLLDLLMPDLSGVQVLERLKGREGIPPVIVVSSDIQDSTRRHCLELGAFDMLHKPMKEKDVVAELLKRLGAS